MDAYSDSVQRIARLTPLAEILALLAQRVATVASQQVAIADAVSCILAEDVAALEPAPPAAVALRDGIAVVAEMLADAGPYAPMPLPDFCRRVDEGEPLPSGCDAVAPFEAVISSAGGLEAVAPVGPGEGLLPRGGDAAPGAILVRAGEQLNHLRIAVLASAGITAVPVRSPRVALCPGTPAPPAALLDLIRAALADSGARVFKIPDAPEPPLQAALVAPDVDAVISVGGTGSGRRDDSVAILRRCGSVAAHGIGIAPGESAAFGFAQARPVLLLPGRLDAALAAWLLLGRPLMRRLAGWTEPEPGAPAMLRRKVTSTLGLAELVPVRGDGDEVEPLARTHLPLAALARADGWLLAAAESEGFPAGSAVTVRSWP